MILLKIVYGVPKFKHISFLDILRLNSQNDKILKETNKKLSAFHVSRGFHTFNENFQTSSKSDLILNNISKSTTLDNEDTKSSFIKQDTIVLLNQEYPMDQLTNITSKVTEKLGKNLHNKKGHPLNLIKQRIQKYFYSNFTNRSGNPLYAVFDNINPIVNSLQNFDNLLFPLDHPGRSSSDTYYVNSKNMLRSHITAHDPDLIRMGLNAFLTVGDVYRRDEIDSSHYPVFHQLDGLRLFTEQELFQRVKDRTGFKLHETDGKRNKDKQEKLTMDASKLLEFDLKNVLFGITTLLFGKNIEYRWVECYFPFTHPSWELEIKYNGKWLEVLGCGVMEQDILNNAGAEFKAGWAFGIGLDRLAMILYQIPDIRLLWSEDRRFLDQFCVENPNTPIIYKPICKYLCRSCDVSFWINEKFSSNDFYDLVRTFGGDNVERVILKDIYTEKGTLKISHCYEISYQHMEKDISLEEVKELHEHISQMASKELGVLIR